MIPCLRAAAEVAPGPEQRASYQGAPNTPSSQSPTSRTGVIVFAVAPLVAGEVALVGGRARLVCPAHEQSAQLRVRADSEGFSAVATQSASS